MEKAEKSKTEEYKYKTALQVPARPSVALGSAPGQLHDTVHACFLFGWRSGFAMYLLCSVVTAGRVISKAVRCGTLTAIWGHSWLSFEVSQLVAVQHLC